MIVGASESDYLRVNPPHPGGMFKDGVLDAVEGYPGMTLGEAAAKLEVSRVTLSRIVSGHAPISVNLALKMEALGWGPQMVGSNINSTTIWLKPASG